MIYKNNAESMMGPFEIRSRNLYEGDGYILDIEPY